MLAVPVNDGFTNLKGSFGYVFPRRDTPRDSLGMPLPTERLGERGAQCSR